MTDVRIELPFPDRRLSPNDRSGWRKKAKVVADYREACAWEAYGARPGWKLLPPLTPPVRAAVTFVVPDRRKRDLDNLLAMLKPAWDGLVDAGMLVGDDSERFSVERAEIVLMERCDHRRVTPQIDGVCTICNGSRSKGEPKVIVVLRSL